MEPTSKTLLDRVRDAIRLKHHSIRTKQFCINSTKGPHRSNALLMSSRVEYLTFLCYNGGAEAGMAMAAPEGQEKKKIVKKQSVVVESVGKATASRKSVRLPGCETKTS